MSTRVSLLDQLLTRIGEGLTSNLSWLNHAYGRAERIIKRINGSDYKLPVIYTGKGSRFYNEYLSMLPDSEIGNFSFFWMPDPRKMEDWTPHVRGRITDPYALIVWLDLRKAYNELDNRSINTIEEDILKALRSVTLPTGSFTINKVYHLPENIYREFSIDEVDSQFLMHPYMGIRIEGELIYDEIC